jgi:hypothetical protein
MDDQLKDIRDALKNCEETHPNLSKIWRDYINIKVKKLEHAINECKNVMISMETQNDLSLENISTLYFIALLNNNDLNVSH